MKKVVIATVLVLLVGAMFVGMAKAENFGYSHWEMELVHRVELNE